MDCQSKGIDILPTIYKLVAHKRSTNRPATRFDWGITASVVLSDAWRIGGESALKRLDQLFYGVVLLAIALLMGNGPADRPALATHADDDTCVSATTTVSSTGMLEEVACVRGPEIRVSLVDFKGQPREIIRDREKNAEQRIEEFSEDCPDKNDHVEWKDCKPDFPDGSTEKNWPVAYVKDSQVEIQQAKFKVKVACPAEDVAVKGIAEIVIVPFAPGVFTLVFESPGKCTFPEIATTAQMTSPKKLPDFVYNFEPLEIKWTVTAAGKKYDAGSSTHGVYVLFNTPTKDLYYTQVDFTTHKALKSATEKWVVAGIWSEFTDRVVRRQEFDPASGAITHDRTQLTYWVPEKKASEQFGTCTNTTTPKMLRNINGQCGAWANFLKDSFAIHGISGTFSEIECGLLNCIQFLVKTWEFGLQLSDQVAAGWQYLKGDQDKVDEPLRVAPGVGVDVVNRKGVPGQGNAEPPPNFGNHFVVRYGGRIYDPSYGEGPFEDLAEWDDKSLSGFCTSHAGHLDCRQNTAGAQTTITP
jgi:hypothetical protein